MVKPYVPPKAYKCQKCDREEDLLLCVRCGETAYCSTRCQRKDWKSHKKSCKPTDRVDLASFFPVFAAIADIAHANFGEHVALLHRITNSPNPSTPPETLPDGRRARVVRLGPLIDKAQYACDVVHWFPKGETMSVRAKLVDRMMREGHVLPIVVGTCIAIMLSIYCSPHATTPNPTRLCYRSSGIADFGVARGKVQVNPEEQLVYIHPDGKIQYGQDPNNHYWIYFETQKGETIYLDCGLYTLNYCVGYTPTLYLSPPEARSHTRLLPALFWDRTMRKRQRAESIKQAPDLIEDKRISFLRDSYLHRAMEQCQVEGVDTYRFGKDCMTFFAVMMGRVEGKTPSEDDMITMIDTFQHGVRLIVHALTDEKWKSFPSDPPMRVDLDIDF